MTKEDVVPSVIESNPVSANTEISTSIEVIAQPPPDGFTASSKAEKSVNVANNPVPVSPSANSTDDPAAVEFDVHLKSPFTILNVTPEIAAVNKVIIPANVVVATVVIEYSVEAPPFMAT